MNSNKDCLEATDEWRFSVKKLVKKNQIIISALAVMIVVAGYLNFTGQEISTSGLETSAAAEEEGDTDISAEDDGNDDYKVNDDGEVVASEENPGEAVMVSNSLGSDYFSSAKLTREQNRAKNKETLLEIINNKAVSSADKKAAVNTRISGRSTKSWAGRSSGSTTCPWLLLARTTGDRLPSSPPTRNGSILWIKSGS